MFKELLGDAFGVIQGSAPLIAGALGSPFAGVVASKALKMVGEKFGIESSNPEEISNAIYNDPSATDKLKEIESTFSALHLNHFPLPSDAELNIKLKWNPTPQ